MGAVVWFVAFVAPDDLGALVESRSLPEQTADELEAIQVIRRRDSDLPIRLLATKLRTRKSFLRGGPKLHIFVVTLRCDHSCRYWQVSRASDQSDRFDMSEATANAAIDRLFDAPGAELTVEFQDGEPLLAFDRIKHIVETITRRNEAERRQIRYTSTSTLHHLSDDILAFLQQHQFHVSMSLDEPAELHDSNRPLPGRNSHARTLTESRVSAPPLARTSAP
jgi:sulfatase maturation enzyme AslB (radical SAM superfamily)